MRTRNVLLGNMLDCDDNVGNRTGEAISVYI